MQITSAISENFPREQIRQTYELSHVPNLKLPRTIQTRDYDILIPLFSNPEKCLVTDFYKLDKADVKLKMSEGL